MLTNFAHAGHDHSDQDSSHTESTVATAGAHQNQHSGPNDIIGLEFVIVSFILAALLTIAAGFAIAKSPKKK